MTKRDILDREAARKMAWSRSLPPDEETPEPTAPADAGEAHERADADAERLAELLSATEEAWAIAAPDMQAKAVRSLANRLAGTSFMVAAKGGGGTVVRLARLLVRHYRTLPHSVRKGAAFSLSWTTLDGPELPDLLVETARLGDRWAALMIERAAIGTDMHLAHPTLGRKLAAVLDDAPDYESRRIAVYWLSSGRYPEAAPALRRRLREPCLGLRWVALTVLLDLRVDRPDIETVTAADVTWLLADAVVHPPSCEIAERAQVDGTNYQEVLLRAVKELPPAGGEVPLTKIIRGDCAHWNETRNYLDEGWALRALAAGYPARAVALVDEGLHDASRYRREHAVRALEDLPWDVAEPRLRDAACDPSPRVAAAACGIFEKRAGSSLTSQPLAGLPVELLDGAPSVALAERATVVRALGHDAREAMAAAVLAEAPSRDALLLTLLLLGEGSVIYATRPGLPHQGQWGPALVERWGEAGAHGLVWLARRHPHGLGSWLTPLIEVLRTPAGAVIADDARRLALEQLQLEGCDTSMAMRIIEAAGVTAECWRPVARQLAELRTRYAAIDTLEKCEPCAELDAYLVAEAERCLAAGDVTMLAAFAQVGLARGLTAVSHVVARAVANADTTNVGPLTHLAWEHGIIDAKWRLRTLRQQESASFEAAVWRLPFEKRAPKREEQALRDALGSTARGGRTCVDAALGLYRTRALSFDSPEIAAVLERSPLALRIPLLAQLGDDAGLDFVWPHVDAILRGTDVAAQKEVLDAFFTDLHQDAWCERLAPIFAQMPEGEPREILAYTLREPSAAVRYWADPPRIDEVRGDDEPEDG